jgi:3-hydroxybutyryl-CoA dehydrogenase
LEVKTIGIIGARKAGSSLACAAALAGYSVILEDVSPEVLAAGMQGIRGVLDELRADGRVSGADCDAAFGGIANSRSVEDVCRVADMLIEALPEELEVKLEIFTIFDKFAKPNTVLTSTTRETAIADLAGITFRGEECAGFRVLLDESNEVRIPNAVEIVRCSETSDATVAACVAVAQRMGMRAIIFHEKVESGETTEPRQ